MRVEYVTRGDANDPFYVEGVKDGYTLTLTKPVGHYESMTLQQCSKQPITHLLDDLRAELWANGALVETSASAVMATRSVCPHGTCQEGWYFHFKGKFAAGNYTVRYVCRRKRSKQWERIDFSLLAVA